ncbi:ferric-chelate reductase [Astrocystis sublimbata]|nr:ferric-chelate reductase [Astrocystis sublimbata]
MSPLAFLIASLASTAAATGPVPVSRSGLGGVDGFTFYDPYCGHGCFRSFSPFALSCSSTSRPGGHTTADKIAHDLAECRASNYPFLSSIAWCVHLYCAQDVLNSTIEKFWETEITGDVNVLPKWSYGEVLASITEPPTVVLLPADADAVLNTTTLTTYENWKITADTLFYFFRETVLESYFGLSLLLTAFGLPLILTWLGYLPFMGSVLRVIKPWTYPSIFRTFHDRSLPFYLGNVPTVGQSLYITLILALNLIFLGAGYKTSYPKQMFQWYSNGYQELLAYFMWRTGVLAFCQMPVLFLFSSRNNILLWLTNWSHSTYMLLHRWIARMFLFQTLLHSIFALVLYKDTGSYATSSVTTWWIWGIVATIASVIIVLTSLLIIRQKAYELFLVTHIVMAIICVVGCWYHVFIMYENTFGCETWLYAAIAVWFVDRIVRVGRLLKTGIKRSGVSQIGPTICRIDIPGIYGLRPGRCVYYVYFPTLNPLRPWENHPFSAIPTAILSPPNSAQTCQTSDEEKVAPVVVASAATQDDVAYTNSGLTLFVRKKAGMTKLLDTMHGHGPVTLLEGPYPTIPTKELLESDRLLLIGGGIGITVLVPFFNCHPNVKLLYSIKVDDECLLESLGAALNQLKEKEISIGRRLDIDAHLREEANSGWPRIGVVVCGPVKMCDHVRATTARLGRELAGRCSFELEVDTFSW